MDIQTGAISVPSDVHTASMTAKNGRSSKRCPANPDRKKIDAAGWLWMKIQTNAEKEDSSEDSGY